MQKRNRIMINSVEITLSMEDIKQAAEAISISKAAIIIIISEVISTTLICNQQMKYLETSLVDEIHLLAFLIMMMISLMEDLEIWAACVWVEAWVEICLMI